MFPDPTQFLHMSDSAKRQDPKTSRWLWDLKERSRQRRRTENYREIMHMQQKIAEPLAKLDSEDESAAARENQVSTLKTIQRLSFWGS